MAEEKKEPEKKSKAKKIRSIIEWVVSGVFIAAAAVLVIFRVIQKQTGKPIPVFGSYYCTVITDSMEPVYKVKDVLLVKKVEMNEIKEGDDITFYWDLNGKGNVQLITHRVISVDYYEDANLNKGYHYTFTVHGINTQSNQCRTGVPCDITWQHQDPHENVVVGKVIRTSGFMKAITSVWGLLLLILLPSSYLLVTTVVDMFKKLDEQKEEEKLEDAASGSLQSLSKKEIEQLKKELLEEMLNKGKK